MALGRSRGAPQVAVGGQSTLSSTNPTGSPQTPPGRQTWRELGKESGWGSLVLFLSPLLGLSSIRSIPQGHQNLCQHLGQPQGTFPRRARRGGPRVKNWRKEVRAAGRLRGSLERPQGMGIWGDFPGKREKSRRRQTAFKGSPFDHWNVRLVGSKYMTQGLGCPRGTVMSSHHARYSAQ